MMGIKEELLELLSKTKDKPVIVEGFKDKKALKNFGIERIKVLKGRALYKVVEEIKDKEAVVLTDLDKEGKKLYGKLKHDLIRHGINVDDKLRNFLFKETKLRQIEGLTRYLEKL